VVKQILTMFFSQLELLIYINLFRTHVTVNFSFFYVGDGNWRQAEA